MATLYIILLCVYFYVNGLLVASSVGQMTTFKKHITVGEALTLLFYTFFGVFSILSVLTFGSGWPMKVINEFRVADFYALYFTSNFKNMDENRLINVNDMSYRNRQRKSIKWRLTRYIVRVINKRHPHFDYEAVLERRREVKKEQEEHPFIFYPGESLPYCNYYGANILVNYIKEYRHWDKEEWVSRVKAIYYHKTCRAFSRGSFVLITNDGTEIDCTKLVFKGLSTKAGIDRLTYFAALSGDKITFEAIVKSKMQGFGDWFTKENNERESKGNETNQQ